MIVILVHGFWLRGSTWGPVLPALRAAGHDVRVVERPDAVPGSPAAALTMDDVVADAVAEIDAVTGPVVLVGHSGGGNVVAGSADARPDRVAQLVYVDTMPPASGARVNPDLPVTDGVVPIPDWSFFREDGWDRDLRDLTTSHLDALQAGARREPVEVAHGELTLRDDAARRALPTTIIASTFTGAELTGWLADGMPWLAETALLTDLDVVDLPTGHWPQITRPDELAAILVQVVGDPSRPEGGPIETRP